LTAGNDLTTNSVLIELHPPMRYSPPETRAFTAA